MTSPQKPSALEEPIPRKRSPLPGANVSALKSLPLKQYDPWDPSAAAPGIPMVSVGTAIESEAQNLSEAVAPDKFSLSNQKHIMNAKDLVSLITTVLADKFSYSRQLRKLIKEQFTEFLPRLGVDNESTFAVLNKEKLWYHNLIHISYSQVTLPVVHLLAQMADYMGTVLQRLKYLTPSI